MALIVAKRHAFLGQQRGLNNSLIPTRKDNFAFQKLRYKPFYK